MSNYLRFGELRAVRELLLSSSRFRNENDRNHRVLVASRELSERDTYMFLRFNRMWPWRPVKEFIYHLPDNPNVEITHLRTCGNCGHLSTGNYRESLIEGNPEFQAGLSRSYEEIGNVFWVFLIFFF